MKDFHALTQFDMTTHSKLKKLITSVGWNDQQVEGQIQSIQHFLKNKESCLVLIMQDQTDIWAFASAEFYAWNRLAQIHGLVVHQNFRRQKIASKLVEMVEDFVKERGGRGIYVDTPTNNTNGRNFYEKIGYKQDYVMTEYYDEQSDGVTYLKLFKWKIT